MNIMIFQNSICRQGRAPWKVDELCILLVTNSLDGDILHWLIETYPSNKKTVQKDWRPNYLSILLCFFSETFYYKQSTSFLLHTLLVNEVWFLWYNTFLRDLRIETLIPIHFNSFNLRSYQELHISTQSFKINLHTACG